MTTTTIIHNIHDNYCLWYSTVLTTSGDLTAAGTGTAELEVSVGEGLSFYKYTK